MRQVSRDPIFPGTPDLDQDNDTKHWLIQPYNLLLVNAPLNEV